MPTAEPLAADLSTLPSSNRSLTSRSFAVLGVLALLGVAVYLLFTTAVGAQLRTDPQLLADRARRLNFQYPLLCVAAFVLIYFFTSLAMLPVWWLQILGGAAFGLYETTALSVFTATVGSLASAGISRWVASDWLQSRVESRLKKLERIDQALGHNGLLVVFAVRLIHLLPFGICNYALGLTRISMRDIAVGTLLGSVPAVAMYVGIGAGYHPWRNGPFLAIVGGLNVLLLVPVALRYWSPKWFRRWGLE